MRKKQEITADKAKGILYFTDILNKLPDANFVELKRKLQDQDFNFETQILYVYNSQKVPIYILKTGSYMSSDSNGIRQAKSEYDIAYELGKNCPYIVKGLAFEEFTDSSTNTYCCEKLFEYGGPNLLEIMNSTGIANEEIVEIASQTANAMNFTHKKGIFHSDLKPENIVYKDKVAKIIDFGVSMDFGRKTEIERYTKLCTGKIVGFTPCYSPPEFLHLQLFKDVMPINREKIDVYSWAMIFYQLLSKKSVVELEQEWEPFRRNFEQYQKFKMYVKALKKDSFYKGRSSKEFVNLLSICLNFCSADRPTFEEISEELSEFCKIRELNEKHENLKENEQKVISEVEEKKSDLIKVSPINEKIDVIPENSVKNEIPFCKNGVIKITTENYTDEQAMQIVKALKSDYSLKLYLKYERQIIYQVKNAENMNENDILINLKHYRTWRKIQPEMSYEFDKIKCTCKSKEAQITLKCEHKLCMICGIANRIESESLILNCEQCGIRGLPLSVNLECGCILKFAEIHKTLLFSPQYNSSWPCCYKIDEIKCRAHSLSITILESVLLKQNQLRFDKAFEENCSKNIGERLANRNVQSSLNFTQTFDEASCKSLGDYLRKTKTLSRLTLYNSKIEVGGNFLGEALANNESLTYFYCNQYFESEAFIKSYGESLIRNKNLTTLKLQCCVCDEGAIAIGKVLLENKTLRILDLSSSGVNVEGAKAIAKALEVNKSIQELSLQHDYIGDEGVKALGFALSLNKSLKILNLQRCDFGEIGAISLGSGLKKNDTLEELYIETFKLSDIASIGDMLCMNKTLKKLYIHLDRISDLSLEKISEGIAQNSTLKNLYLCCYPHNFALYKNFTDALGKNKGLKNLTCLFGNSEKKLGELFGKSLIQNSYLTHLKLCHCLFDEDAMHISEALTKNQTLLHLDLYLNKIGIEGAKALGSALKINKTISYLNLNSNEIKKEGANFIAEALTLSTSLLELYINYSNEIGNDGAIAFGKALEVNSSLKKLDLYQSRIGEIGGRAICESLAKNNSLIELILEGNGIGNEGAFALGAALIINKTLVKLDIGRSSIKEEGMKAIAEGIAKNKGLKKLFGYWGKIDASSAMATALEKNTTLEYFDYSCIDGKSLGNIGYGLTKNQTLKQLKLLEGQFYLEDAKVFLEHLKCNYTLSKLHINISYPFYKGEETLKFFKSNSHFCPLIEFEYKYSKFI